MHPIGRIELQKCRVYERVTGLGSFYLRLEFGAILPHDMPALLLECPLIYERKVVRYMVPEFPPGKLGKKYIASYGGLFFHNLRIYLTHRENPETDIRGKPRRPIHCGEIPGFVVASVRKMLESHAAEFESEIRVPRKRKMIFYGIACVGFLQSDPAVS